jgi:two-component system cell cycle response regulator DivK
VNSVILYIEDNADNIKLVERLLRPYVNTRLHVAVTAADGVRIATEAIPDLILLDNRLPDATGADVLRQLSAVVSTAAIPVIVLTGDADRRTADELMAAGASDYLAKPFDIHQFRLLIERYLLVRDSQNGWERATTGLRPATTSDDPLHPGMPAPT